MFDLSNMLGSSSKVSESSEKDYASIEHGQVQKKFGLSLESEKHNCFAPVQIRIRRNGQKTAGAKGYGRHSDTCYQKILRRIESAVEKFRRQHTLTPKWLRLRFLLTGWRDSSRVHVKASHSRFISHQILADTFNIGLASDYVHIIKDLRVADNDGAVPPLVELAMGLVNRIIQSLEVTHEPNLTLTEQLITNEDLLPVEPEKQTWRAYNYVAFWIADMFNVYMWMIECRGGKPGYVYGWVMALAAPFLVLNARPGAVFHVMFPIVNRTSFGMFGSLWTSIGGSCVLVMLRAMWPSINDLLIWFPVHKVSSVWCIVKAHGIGPIVHQPSTLHGSKLGWAMVVTIITNAPDFASRARTPSAALYPQLVASPVTAAFAIYGTAIWSPIVLLENFLNDNPSKATRFGVWFISTSFMLAQVTSRILFGVGYDSDASSPSWGCDLTALFPRFINIRRGGYIAAIVGLAMCPWNLLKNSNEFTSYLSAYSVFLSSIAGVMVTEYYIVRKGHYNIKDLYRTGKGTWYWYTYGINFRAYAAYISGILINAVGFAGATGRTVPLAATRIYDLSFFTGFGVSALVYWALNRVFPVVGAADRFEEIDVSGYGYKAGGLRDAEEMDIDAKDEGRKSSGEAGRMWRNKGDKEGAAKGTCEGKIGLIVGNKNRNAKSRALPPSRLVCRVVKNGQYSIKTERIFAAGSATLGAGPYLRKGEYWLNSPSAGHLSSERQTNLTKAMQREVTCRNTSMETTNIRT
ncbi:permease for cytosine/purines, uracil, thiamine, allantoin-domain-containing protein [Suillus paluster]|uniref:permease for cytosine/purines, uracil, thiamine, allantoin-domain-containing protein n=1 Tax=Suillus paluster TaxID=48578 RepID=UPI001B85DC81|nr:permease for cytosine/purines, uracil, thiamine, allantoin-domain-containing protein [Suillus paluster]KAG1730820.1 permease for cytosine/purines, uracil, thiamine, allantoin-domain-containing protein [Suillus paluster]